jgi:hypothetical protein
MIVSFFNPGGLSILWQLFTTFAGHPIEALKKGLRGVLYAYNATTDLRDFA